MYRTLLKCVSTLQVEKALRIITVISSSWFFFFSFFNSTLQVLITISLKNPLQAFFRGARPRQSIDWRGKTQKFSGGRQRDRDGLKEACWPSSSSNETPKEQSPSPAVLLTASPLMERTGGENGGKNLEIHPSLREKNSVNTRTTLASLSHLS